MTTDSRNEAKFDVLVQSMVLLSNAATFSLVWLVLALGGIVVAGASRPFFVLLLALPVEFIVTNGPLKAVFRRERPASFRRGEIRPGVRLPKTSSFPSGHAASAAMSTLLLADTSIVVVVGILATGIAISRVYLRLHHVGDVVGGLAWGAVLGLAIRHVAAL